MNAAIIERLLDLQPFQRFYLITASGHEYEVNRRNELRVLEDVDVVVWSAKGTTDFINARLIERIRIDGDFGFAELDQMWK